VRPHTCTRPAPHVAWGGMLRRRPRSSEGKEDRKGRVAERTAGVHGL
jgi:hypothetical protein